MTTIETRVLNAVGRVFFGTVREIADLVDTLYGAEYDDIFIHAALASLLDKGELYLDVTACGKLIVGRC